MNVKVFRSPALVLVLSMLLIAGCSEGTEIQTDPDAHDSSMPAEIVEGPVTSIVEFDEMVDEFVQATADYELPEGNEFVEPINPGPEVRPDGTEGESVYERGYGSTVAFSQWRCAWARHWLEVRESEPEAAAEALEELGSLFERDVFIRWYDQSSAVSRLERMLEQASLGDPSLMQQDIELNCV